MELDEWKILGQQMLAGFAAGALTALAATQSIEPAIWAGVLLAAVRGAAQYGLRMLEPETALKQQRKWSSSTRFSHLRRLL